MKGMSKCRRLAASSELVNGHRRLDGDWTQTGLYDADMCLRSISSCGLRSGRDPAESEKGAIAKMERRRESALWQLGQCTDRRFSRAVEFPEALWKASGKILEGRQEIHLAPYRSRVHHHLLGPACCLPPAMVSVM